MTYENLKKALYIAVPVLIAVISIFVVARKVSAPEYTAKYTEVIEANRESVMKLTASSTAVSVAISALPGDIGTPISEKFADLSLGFMAVLCALYLEEFLVVITGLVVFKWMIPVACILFIIGRLADKKFLKDTAYKICVLSLAFILIIPASIGITKAIRNTYGDKIDETIDSAELSADLIQDSIKNGAEDDEAGNGLAGVLKNLIASGDGIAAGTSEFMRYVEKLLTRFVDAVAILIVTSCIIPVLVILALVWFVKIIFLPGEKR